ncbi:MAG: hypothetical protein EXS15_08870 [Phycisphaerales bacterium]|nr:hypothetical protein [Phycisphaerales bacterium]
MTAKSATAGVMWLVVGAHPEAERVDRPIAVQLQGLVERALAANHDAGVAQMRVQILTDLWYMNDAALVASPAIALGTANTNAAVAHLALRLPPAVVVDGQYEILFDRTDGDHRVALRGVDSRSTARAVEVFCEKFLDQWLDAASSAIRVVPPDPQCL